MQNKKAIGFHNNDIAHVFEIIYLDRFGKGFQKEYWGEVLECGIIVLQYILNRIDIT